MNSRKAKQLRRIAKNMVSSFNDAPVIRFFVQKMEDGSVKDTLIPMPLEWAQGTSRRIYQDLK